MGAGHSSSQGAGAVACFCGPFVGISRSVAPVLLVTRPLKAEQSSGAVSWPLALFRVTCFAFKLAQGGFSLLLWHCLFSEALSHSSHNTNVLRD